MDSGTNVLRDRLVIALDRPDLASALDLVDRLGDSVAWYKVGLELYGAAGRDAVREVAARGKRVFLDLKLHDIPATVERAIRVLDGLPVGFLTVHAAGGPAMLEAAAKAAHALPARPRVLGVTMLTSLDGTEQPDLWNPRTTLEEKVLALARGASRAGCDGVVASPRELPSLRRELKPPFLLVTPGIRGPKDPAGDQKRTLTLPEAIGQGADYVVVGRPVTAAPDPRAAVAALAASLGPAPTTERTHA
jgi:orotidine-5'-phosphate decarboxylase